MAYPSKSGHDVLGAFTPPLIGPAYLTVCMLYHRDQKRFSMDLSLISVSGIPHGKQNVFLMVHTLNLSNALGKT